MRVPSRIPSTRPRGSPPNGGSLLSLGTSWCSCLLLLQMEEVLRVASGADHYFHIAVRPTTVKRNIRNIRHSLYAQQVRTRKSEGGGGRGLARAANFGFRMAETD